MTTELLDAPTILPFPVSISSHAGASFFCRLLTARGFDRVDAPRILIAGCGAGHEAIAIQETLHADVDAVDIEDFVDPHYASQTKVRFDVASVCELPFSDQQFDAIFFHHVIEHVEEPQKSLQELSRVLKPSGWLFVGTPNRHRLVSSVGAHEQSEWEATFQNKLRDNLRDWKDRLTGRFRNELGAHAGFSQGELDRMLALHFEEREWVTGEYLQFKYGTHRWKSLLPVVSHPVLRWFLAPSIYALCRKSDRK